MLVWKEFMKAKYLISTKVATLFYALILLSCGGGDDSSESPPGSTSNIAPVANAGNNQTVDENTVVTLDASASTDSDGSISSYQWSQTAGTAAALSASNVAMPTFTTPPLNASETLIFQVTVTDNDGATNTATVSIMVNHSNVPPTANAGSEQTVDEQTLIMLSAELSDDVDGTIATYLWTQTSGPVVTLSDSTSLTPEFTAPDIDAVTTLTFELVVTDDQGATDSVTTNIFVNPTADNQVPNSMLEDSLLINELYFEYSQRIGEKVWVLGFYGNTEINNDGAAFLVDNMLRLEIDEQLAHHSFTRLDGLLPPDDWQGNQILVYGEIKDFEVDYGQPAIQPTPLISVEKYELVSTFEQNNSWDNGILPPDVAPENLEAKQATSAPLIFDNYSTTAFNKQSHVKAGVQAQDCDRSVIISGGVDASNNHSRYVDNVIAKFNKMKELGFSDEQIEIFYNNGATIDVNGNNVVDQKTSKEKIQEHFEALAESMPGSCTLTIFVTDHGTGFNFEQGYEGARPALSGEEATTGSLHDENTFRFDARPKTYRTSASFVLVGEKWFVTKEESGKVNLFKREGTKWVLKGSDSNGDGLISETELGGEDLNQDDDETDNDFGFDVANLETRLTGRNYRSNEWDTDGDGNDDVRVRWDGSRFVVERLDAGEWKEMGRDTNGDYFIDIIDGGVDWNLDGDTADQIGFHEGINLWGNEVLWDDEFAELLKPLSEKGVHIMMEMVSCFSGGFTPNLGPYVENIYAGSSEDTKHYNRKGEDGKYFATDEMAFLDNLAGIDTDSWNTAADAATAADDALADAQNATRNIHVHEQTLRFETGTVFDTAGEGEYDIFLDLPDDLVGQIYDFEFILGLQNPRWQGVSFPDGLPSGLQFEDAPGGIRVFSDNPIPDELVITIAVEGEVSEEKMRIEFTDVDHKRLGYTMAAAEAFGLPEQLSFSNDYHNCVNHTDHGENSPSILEWVLFADVIDQSEFTDIAITVLVSDPSGNSSTHEIVLNEEGKALLLYQIFVFGDYDLQVISARNVPTEEALQVIGNIFFPFQVTAEETNKGQCSE